MGIEPCKKKFPFPPAKILFLQQIVVDAAGDGVCFFLNGVEFEFAAIDYGTDESWDGEGCDDGEDYDGIEKVVIEHSKVFTDGGGGEGGGELGNGHETGADTFGVGVAGKFHSEESGEDFAADETDDGKEEYLQIADRAENSQVGIHTDGDE